MNDAPDLLQTRVGTGGVGRRVRGSRPHAPVLAALVLFSLAMAWVEAAAIAYLRTLYGTLDPASPRGALAAGIPNYWDVEVAREVATVVMLGAVGWLAGRGASGRVGAFVFCFGIWDIGYYAFLRICTGWPRTLLDSDILLQVPLPWWGPVIAPVLIALVMVGGGGLAVVRDAADRPVRPRWQAWILLASGTAVCLVAFMLDALRVLPQGGFAAALHARAGQFPWALYSLGLALGVAGTAMALLARSR